MRWRLAMAALTALAACGGAPPGPATIRLALGSDVCADFCAETLRASLYREGETIALGPPTVTACGDDFVIGDLPAGLQVHVEVEVLGIAGEPLLKGTSDLVTVAADANVDVPVPLAALVSPEITAVWPDPVAPGADPVPLTVTGSGFADPGGAYGVELDGVALALTDPVSWSDDTVLATLSPGESGAELVVRRCGVGSAPAPVRVVAREAPAAAAVALPPSCAGRRVVALAPDGGGGDGALAAIACDDPGLAYLQHLTADGACPLGVADFWPLGDNPVALAATDGAAWVAVAGGGTLRIELAGQGRGGQPASEPLAEGVSAVALAAVPGPRVFAIGDDGERADLYELDPETGVGAEVADVDGLALAALGAGVDHVYAVGTTGAVGKLVAVRLSDDLPKELPLSDCANPVRAATGPGAWVAVACDEADGAHVVGVDPGDDSVAPLSWGAGTPSAVALDAVGDVALAFAADGTELVAFDADGASQIASWGAVATGPALRLGEHHRFLVVTGAGDALTVIAPYQEAPLCE